MAIQKAGVIGAGAMGSEITQAISAAGIPVVMKDINQEALNKGLSRIQRIYNSAVEKGRMTQADAELKSKLVIPTTAFSEFKDVDFVVEAAPEFLDLKKKAFQDLDGACPPHTIFATNTSSLSVSELASVTKRSNRVVGMHFFNPAHVMKLVEVVPGLTTGKDTVQETLEFAKRIKKLPVTVQECPGFLVNRLLLPYLNECCVALQEGPATVQQIDDQMKQFGWPMGPFTLMDMLGLDVCAEVARVLRRAFGPRVRAAEIFDPMVAAGRLGQKNGAGFYDYGKLPTTGSQSGVPVGPAKKSTDEVVQEVRKSTGAKPTRFDALRPMLVMINEGVMCVQEQVSTPAEVDVAMVAGTGFPQDKQGPLHYADALGLDTVLKEMERGTQEWGGPPFGASLAGSGRFWPYFRLKTMVGAGMLGVKSKQGFFNYP